MKIKEWMSWFKKRNIFLKLGISQEKVQHITEALNYKKYVRWVPWQLTDAQKEHGKNVCQELLTQYRHKWDDFFLDMTLGFIMALKQKVIYGILSSKFSQSHHVHRLFEHKWCHSHKILPKSKMINSLRYCYCSLASRYISTISIYNLTWLCTTNINRSNKRK